MKKSLFVSMFACTALALSACGEEKDEGGLTGGTSAGTAPTATAGDAGDGADATADGGDGGDGGDGADSAGDDSGSADGGDGGDGGTSGGGDETGGSFIQEPDGGGTDIECDIWMQDCPDGEKCMPWANDGGSSWNATKCSPVDPNPMQPGDACTVEGNGVSGVDNCDVSSMCWDVDNMTNMGTCIAFCTGSDANPMCEDPMTTCVIANDGVLILCLPACDPLLQDCPEGQACYPVNDGLACAPDASGPDMGVQGDPCEYINACDPGLACLNATVVDGCMGASGCCSAFCDTAEADMCPGANECTLFYDMDPPPGFETLGVCSLPA